MGKPSGVWAHVAQMAGQGRTPLIRVDSAPLPPERVRVHRPTGPKKRGMTRAGPYRTQWMHGQERPYCFAGCGKRLGRNDVLVCGPECREMLLVKAKRVVELLTTPPAAPEVVYVDFLRGGLVRRVTHGKRRAHDGRSGHAGGVDRDGGGGGGGDGTGGGAG